MAKFYVQSGPVRLVLDAASQLEAAIKAFQWTCDRQATIDSECPIEHLEQAELRGWQLHEYVQVSERGFQRGDSAEFDTLLVVAAWQEDWERRSLAQDEILFEESISGG
jgi:hypothetical protein